jgi:hypothetical protein
MYTVGGLDICEDRYQGHQQCTFRQWFDQKIDNRWCDLGGKVTVLA